MRVKEDGKLSNAVTEFSHEAARPMFSLGVPALGGSVRRKI
jgi:hypothetical protein